MNFELSEEQILLQDSIEKYLRDNYRFEQRQQRLRGGSGPDSAHWRGFSELGWLALPFAEADGGLGGGPLEILLLCEAFGRHLVVEPYLETVLLCGGLIAQGSGALRARWLPRLLEGGVHGALACAEPGRQQSLHAVATRAQQRGDSWLLNGEKCAVFNAPAADVLIVSARTAGTAHDRGGIGLFAVPASAPGLERCDYLVFDGRCAADIRLSDVMVDADALIGAADDGLPLLEALRDRALLALCAEAVGAMDALNRATFDYTRERRQFGQLIARFQVLQHRMADMYMQLELTRSLLLAAARQCEAGAEDAPKILAALKAKVGKSARFIGQNALQLHGGIAMTDELNVGHYFKRLTLIENLFGGTDAQLRRFYAGAHQG